MNIVLIGVLMMVVFMAAILSKKVSALTAWWLFLSYLDLLQASE